MIHLYRSSPRLEFSCPDLANYYTTLDLHVDLSSNTRLCLKTRIWLPFGSEPQDRRRAALFLKVLNRCCRSYCRIKAAALLSRLAASGYIDDRTNPPMADFAVFARRKNCSLSGRRRSFQTEPGTAEAEGHALNAGEVHGGRIRVGIPFQGRI